MREHCWYLASDSRTIFIPRTARKTAQFSGENPNRLFILLLRGRREGRSGQEKSRFTLGANNGTDGHRTSDSNSAFPDQREERMLLPFRKEGRNRPRRKREMHLALLCLPHPPCGRSRRVALVSEVHFLPSVAPLHFVMIRGRCFICLDVGCAAKGAPFLNRADLHVLCSKFSFQKRLMLLSKRKGTTSAHQI